MTRPRRGRRGGHPAGPPGAGLLGAGLLAAALLLAGCGGGAQDGLAAAGEPVATGSDATGAGTPVPEQPDPDVSAALAAADLPPCPDSDPAVAPVAGGLPDVTLPCLGVGPDVRLAGLRGTPLVLNVWASWCPPCVAEMPMLADAARRAGDRIRFLGVDLLDDRTAALLASADLGVPYPSAIDRDGVLRSALGFPGPPLTLFVTADGEVVGRYLGQIPDEAALDAAVEEHFGITLGAAT